MVSGENMKKYALISVYKKSKLNIICNSLKKFGIGIISTGSTFSKIKGYGYECLEISKFTNTKEILNGRVKTLHHKIYTSILHKRNDTNHVKTFDKMSFPTIDFIIVNLYPFEKFLDKNSNEEKIIEMIDIGGPSLLRASSKNYKSVTTISSIGDYNSFVKNLNKNKGVTDLNFRKRMAQKAFSITSKYDQNISDWFLQNNRKEFQLRYGENPNQKSKFLKTRNKNIVNSQIYGKKISYNNILDINSGLDFLKEFIEPTVVVIKHNNACGIASSSNIKNSFLKAIKSDEKSAFGGIILINRKLTKELTELISKRFFEVVVTTEFSEQSLKILKQKENLILVESKRIDKKETYNKRSVRGGYLIQKIDNKTLTKNDFDLVSNNKKISKGEFEDVVFAYKVVKHLKSNAVVLVKNKQVIGVGTGQMNRLDAVRIAIMKYKDNFNLKNYVCASDAFFPFTDSLKILFKNNCSCVVQPSGSINDKKIIQFVNKKNKKLLFSNNRVFKH